MNAPNGIPRMPGLDPAIVDRGMNPVDPAQGAVNYGLTKKRKHVMISPLKVASRTGL